MLRFLQSAQLTVQYMDTQCALPHSSDSYHDATTHCPFITSFRANSSFISFFLCIFVQFLLKWKNTNGSEATAISSRTLLFYLFHRTVCENKLVMQIFLLNWQTQIFIVFVKCWPVTAFTLPSRCEIYAYTYMVHFVCELVFHMRSRFHCQIKSKLPSVSSR